MKLMSNEERHMHYNSILKQETRQRIKEFLKTTSDEIEVSYTEKNSLNLFTINEVELSNKIKAYEEIIDLFKDYEFESILNSIYFEKLGYQLLLSLRNKLLESIPADFNDKYSIISFLRDAKNEKLHKIILEEKLEITKGEWIAENEYHNPIITKLSSYLEEKLVSSGTKVEIKLTLFHYSKFWIHKYSNEKTENKNILLLNKLRKTLSESLTQLKVNLNNILLELKSELDSLLEINELPPYLEIFNSNWHNKSFSNGYKNQLDNFSKLLTSSNDFLFALDKLTVDELISKYIMSDKLLQYNIYTEIEKRIENGYIISKFDLTSFVNRKTSILSNDNYNLVSLICRKSYLFSQL